VILAHCQTFTVFIPVLLAYTQAVQKLSIQGVPRYVSGGVLF
jgi:hypothetical protein